MTTTTHVLKTTAAYFAAVWSGEKTFEVRYDDRGYQRGHEVRLREFDPTIPCDACSTKPGEPWHVADDCQKYSGREIHAEIGHVLASTPAASKARPGFNGHGYVVFSLLNVGTFERDLLGEHMRLMFGLADDDPQPSVTPAEAARRIAQGGDRS